MSEIAESQDAEKQHKDEAVIMIPKPAHFKIPEVDFPKVQLKLKRKPRKKTQNKKSKRCK
jgi:hypothetical protein